MRYLLLALAAASLHGQSVVISQIYGGGGNTGAVWRNDFVELFNRGTEPVSVDGWSVQYASAAGTTWTAAPIAGTIAPGQYYLVQLAAGAGGMQALPAPDATGTLALSATSGKIALARLTTPLHELANRPFLQDFVGYGAAATEFKIAPTRDLSNTTAAVRAGAGCVDSGNNQADFAIAAPNPRNSMTARTDCAAAPVPAPRLTISQIQGNGDTSPYVDRRVITRGVVYARRSNGFYIESLAADDDGNAATSEGILVFTSAAPPAVALIGDLVDVEGTVTEFRPAADPGSPTLTELTGVTVMNLGRNPEFGRRLTILSSDGDWERFEGMRISIFSGICTGPSGGSFSDATGQSTPNGIFYAVENGVRPFRRPGLAGDSTRGVLRIDSRGLGGPAAEVAAGTFVSATGPLDFGARAYTLLAENGVLTAGPALREPRPVPAAAAGEFTIATLNLQRFFDTATAFPARVAKLKLYVENVLKSPDIIALQEAGSGEAVMRVASELGGYLALRGATNDPSGIAPGYLVKTSTVTVLTAVPYATEARFGADNQLVHDRPPYRLDFRIGGQRMALLCVHLRSLNDIADARVQAKRRAQAESINALARGIAAENIPFAILGDFNAFPFDDGYADIPRIVGEGLNLTNLNTLLQNGDNYSYVFNGATQALDHILLSPGMRQWVTRAAYAGANADFPELARADAATPLRISDHDAAVAWFGFEARPFTALSITNAASFQSGSIAANEIVTIFGRGLDGTRLTIGGRAVAVVQQSATQWSVSTPGDLAGSGTVEVALERNGQRVHGVEVPLAPSSPALFATQPAGRRGQIIELWGTGFGAGQSTVVRMCGALAEVFYSGQAPGLAAGAWQINARIPDQCATGTSVVEVSAGSRTSPEIPLFVRD